MALSDVVLMAEAAAENSGPVISPYFVGGGVLSILLFALFALLAFGRGREHS